MNTGGPLYPESPPELARRRRKFAPDMQAAFEAFGRQAFAAITLWGFILHGLADRETAKVQGK